MDEADKKPGVDQLKPGVDRWRIALFVGMLLLVVWGVVAGRTTVVRMNDAPGPEDRLLQRGEVFGGVRCPVEGGTGELPTEIRVQLTTTGSEGTAITRVARARLADGALVLAASGAGSGVAHLADGRIGDVAFGADGCAPIVFRDPPPPEPDAPAEGAHDDAVPTDEIQPETPPL